MVTIAPSILSADFGEINAEIAAAGDAGAEWIHLDVMDGRFVPNLTFGAPVIKRMAKPPGLVFDAHLMVVEPENLIEGFAEAGVHQLTVHAEATTHLHRTLARIREAGMKAGVALNPATPPEAIEWVLEDVDMVLAMSVNPGFGGQRYIPQTTSKIAKLASMISEKGLGIPIQVDGGITPETIGEVAAAGATIFVAGTAVFGKSNYKQAIGALRKAAEAPPS